jgi:hypothetical protein
MLLCRALRAVKILQFNDMRVAGQEFLTKTRWPKPALS